MESVFDRAYAAHQAGRLDEAEQGYRATLEAQPGHVDALNLLGLLRHRQGQPAEAAELIRQAVKLRPTVAALHLNLGTMLKACNRPYDALDSFRDSLTLAPEYAPAHFNLGNTLLELGRNDEALAALLRAQRLAPNDPAVASNLGNALAALGRHDEAIISFRRSLEVLPGHPGSLNNLGLSLNALGQPEQALAAFQAAVSADPRFPAALFHLGQTLAALDQAEAALPHFEASLTLQPDFVPARVGLADTLSALQRHREARPHYEHALGLDPGCIPAWLELGAAHHALGEPERALRAYDEVLRRDPDHVLAQMHRAVALLALRDFERGLPAYEARHALAGAPQWPLPIWRGEPISTRTLFVPLEGGPVQMLQYARFLARARQRCARLIVEVQAELLPLISAMAPIWDIEVIAAPAQGQAGRTMSIPAHAELVCPLLSLPFALGLTFAELGMSEPYLRVPARPQATGTPVATVTARMPRRQFGIVWSGLARRQHPIPLAMLEPLFTLDDIEWFVLQDDLGKAERTRLADRARFAARGYVHVPPASTSAPPDLAALAATIASLDGVVATDGVVAHLAGALGKPCWLMLPLGANWRWFTGDTAPWYPHMRLVRQSEAGRWQDVIARIAAQLAR